MAELQEYSVDHPALRLLEPGETVMVVTDILDGRLLVTDRRVAVSHRDRLALDVPYEGLRRIQFDIERRRPAVLVIVPERPADEPQVMSVPPERYRAVTDALAIIAAYLYDVDVDARP